MMIHFPEKKLTVIALSNLNGAAPDQIAEYVASVALGEKVVLPSERKSINVPASVLADYAGTYRLQPGFDLVVTLEGAQLMTQATGQSKFPVFAESETKFFPKVVDAQIEFVRGKDGKVDHLILRQGGHDTEAPRVSSQP